MIGTTLAAEPTLAPAGNDAEDPIRICFPFSGDSVGGSHVSVQGLIDQLDPARYQATVVPEIPGGAIARTFADAAQLPDPVASGPGFVPGEAFGVRKALQTLGGIRRRARFLRNHRFDIVHVNDGRTSANWAVAARLAGARLVWHHRGDPDAMGLRLAAPMLADRVLTVSSFALPRPGVWSAARKAQVVHSPFDTSLTVDRDAARAALREELGFVSDPLVIGFVGSFVPRKRPLVFIDTAVALQDLIDRPVLALMFGEARVPAMAKAVADRVAASASGARVLVMGHRTPGPFWIAACDQLVVPAVGEPFGRTLIESMLVGTPVIAAASGGNVEALEGGLGILVPADDAKALAQACASLALDPGGSYLLATRAQLNARHRFSAAHHGATVAQVYDELIRKPHAA